MQRLEPIMVTAHNAAQAEYLLRSRADQRNVRVHEVAVAPGGGDSWLVTLTVTDEDVAAGRGLADDTQVLRLDVLARHRDDIDRG